MFQELAFAHAGLISCGESIGTIKRQLAHAPWCTTKLHHDAPPSCTTMHHQAAPRCTTKLHHDAPPSCIMQATWCKSRHASGIMQVAQCKQLIASRDMQAAPCKLHHASHDSHVNCSMRVVTCIKQGLLLTTRYIIIIWIYLSAVEHRPTHLH